MTNLADKIDALAEKATNDPLDDDGEYFSESGFDDLTQCRHGETGRYSNGYDGKLIALLWNERETLTRALRDAERMREALEAIKARKWDTMTEGCDAAAEAKTLAIQALGDNT